MTVVRAHAWLGTAARPQRPPCKAVLRPSAGSAQRRRRGQASVPADQLVSDGRVDIILSSGFLAFAAHAGFLQAVEVAGLPVNGIMGTSSGAIAGSLFAAGYSASQVAAELARLPPAALLDLAPRPWEGALALSRVVQRLRMLLPARFEDLGRDFGVGVVDSSGKLRLVRAGVLPEAVAASAAIPVIFAPVAIPGRSDGPFRDGGVVDRTGLAAWAQRGGNVAAEPSRSGMGWAGQHANRVDTPEPGSHDLGPNKSPGSKTQRPTLLHLIHRSSGLSGNDAVPAEGAQLRVVRSPQSGASFFDLGDFQGQRASAFARTLASLRHWRVSARHVSEQDRGPPQCA